VLIIIREEYIGQLYEMEKFLPGIFDFRLRVEPMRGSRVREVILKSCASFNISLEEPADELCAEMIGNIDSVKGSVQLPYLQVYLDMLYRDDFQRTYGNNAPEIKPWPPLTFSRKEIEDSGEIEDILERFLKDQEQEITRTLGEQIAPQTLPPDFVDTLLDHFVTEEGTRRPLPVTLHEGLWKVDPEVAPELARFPPELLSKGLNILDQSRVLRNTDRSFELMHDALAKIIDQRRSNEQSKVNEVKNRLKSAYREWELSQRKQYLSKAQLASMKPVLPKIKLTGDLQRFIDISERQVKRRSVKKVSFWLALFLLALSAFSSAQWLLAEKRSRVKLLDHNRDIARQFVYFSWPFIYELRYGNAFQTMKTTQTPENAVPDTDSLLYEIAFFYAESGQIDSANECLTLMRRLDTQQQQKEQPASLHFDNQGQLRIYLKKIDSVRYAAMEAKYFPRLVPLEGGLFNTGHPKNKPDSSRAVRVSDFAIAETETTVWQYGIFVASFRPSLDTMMGRHWNFQGELPIDHISWFEAARYANWVSKRYGLDTAYVFLPGSKPGLWEVYHNKKARSCYRLPTETEWEYAAKGGRLQDTTLYAGSDDHERVAWVKENSMLYNFHRAHKIKQKAPNSAGLYDMSGNLWEWCHDRYANVPGSAGVDPAGPENGNKRTIRGGSYNYIKGSSMVFRRTGYFPEQKMPHIGMRLVRVGSQR
jgi:formylglycine-generating enzyme required for sulfatase activity